MFNILKGLISFRLNPCLLGTKYIAAGIMIKLKNNNIKFMDLYKEIAIEFNTNYKCVEKNIRNAIKNGFDNTNPKLIEKFLLGYKSANYFKYSDYEKNSVFIELFTLYFKHCFFTIIYYFFLFSYKLYTLMD